MEKKFKPFDKVLVRDDYSKWYCAFYSHCREENEHEELCHYTTATAGYRDADILPYEGNEELVGTSDSPDEEVRLGKEERIICNGDVKLLMQGIGFLTTFSYSHGDTFYTGKSRFVDADYNFAIRFSDFNPDDMEETKKHILCVKNGKIVRYKG